MTFKIYKGYDTNFVISLDTIPTSIQFVVPITGSFSVTGSFSQVANGVQVDLSSAQTATFPTGSAQVYAVVSGIPVDIGSVTIAELSTYTKSHARTVLEALEATLEGRATKEQTEVQVAGRMVKYLSLTDILTAISQYRQLVAQEDATNSIIKGNSFSGILRTRWGH